MEAVEEHPVINASTEDLLSNVKEGNILNYVADSNVCQSNGVEKGSKEDTVPEQVTENIEEQVIAETDHNAADIPAQTAEDTKKVTTEEEENNKTEIITPAIVNVESACEPQHIEDSISKEEDTDAIAIKDTDGNEQIIINDPIICPDTNENAPQSLSTTEQPVVENTSTSDLITPVTEDVGDVESTTIINDGIHFETEVIVEKNDNDVNENIIETEFVVVEAASPSTNNILSELGENIELSEVLQSSDMANGSENNNASAKEEVFNKEELLDILEGNDVVESQIDDSVLIKSVNELTADLETQKALKQLSMLKKTRKPRTPKSNRPKENIKKLTKTSPKKTEIPTDINETMQEKENNIVNELVMDWDDDDHSEANCKEEKIIIKENSAIKDRPPVNTLTNENVQKQIKSEDEATPGATRRLGRVIKKKVIFDPDNPDTFTKTPKSKDIQGSKEPPLIKKSKVETLQPEKSALKSPTAKLQWKKPSPRNSKQHKRLSEVDKLLMDEGAVNMIYQLTPEAPKGKKNVKTKAEFIKKLQSSTPDGKEMKFRERKKEAKYEDGDARKLLGGKHRSSLSSSVKSPSVSEDFETHSADDSIIYRRHSSSSYSSSCMSPRRLSDVEGATQNSKLQQIPLQAVDSLIIDESKELPEERTFLSDSSSFNIEDHKNDVINKEGCLSLKEKLKSKLSIALNKRKRESLKSEKPAKQKKILKTEEQLNISKTNVGEFNFVSILIEQHLAEICFKNLGLQNSIQVFNELEQALKFIDDKPEVSVTLISSQCGTLCSSLDLSILIDENIELRKKNAFDLAESVRSLLVTVSRHTKLLCCGVWGACSGVTIPLVAMCDVALASECATFALAAAPAPTLPGAAALTATHRALPQTFVNDLVVFGRRISAAEALRGGLITRSLWPDRFDEQARNIVKDIAIQPPHAILLKKRLLGLKKSGEAEATFLSSLESERDLLVEYWTSVEGQDLLRTALGAS
ncbi:unnamed protein product [Leptosia nina]|uniref:Uncharacterized protein n=1 Tax=Leptosia nina TaxID=320188 RepID=A0AAV1K6S1_9NEOP